MPPNPSAPSGLFRRRLRHLYARMHPMRSSGPRTSGPHSFGPGLFARMRRRPAAPRFWRDIAPVLRARDASPPPDAERVRYWRLVLDAKHIPWRTYGSGEGAALYVPPVSERAALHEIIAFETEKPLPPMPRPPEKPGAYRVIVLLLLLAVWHRLRWEGTVAPGGNGNDWLQTAGLDTYRVTALHEWWRCVTALTIHADMAHLVSNIVTGGIFGVPLCRYTGVGLGFLLTVLAGALGNALTALLRTTPHMSQGFSTAVFASVGLLAAIAAALAFAHTFRAVRALNPAANAGRTALRRAAFEGVIPLGAGLGMLAMFGGSAAPRVDYLAHTMGLAAGTGLGLLVATLALTLTPHLFSQTGARERTLQTAALALAFALIIGCWSLAFQA